MEMTDSPAARSREQRLARVLGTIPRLPLDVTLRDTVRGQTGEPPRQ